mgnify:CR=1 FL=1
MASLWSRVQRLLRHRWTEGQVSRAFPPEVLLRLERHVTASEARHSGQIRLCVEGGLPYSYIWRGATARSRAVALFGKLRVWDTEHNNGVLIYLLMADHAIEIVADRALHRAVPAHEWQAVLEGMQHSFRQDAYAQGMEAALERVTTLMVQHFPSTPQTAVHADATLPDSPVVQGRFFKDL